MITASNAIIFILLYLFIAMLNSLIFDMDGVLIDSMTCHADAWIRTFQDIGIEIKREDIYDIEGANHKGVIDYVCSMAGKEVGPEQVEALRVRKRNLFFKCNTFSSFPGMQECVRQLKQKYDLAVVSGSDRPIVENVIEGFFPDTFDIIVSGADVEHGKPDPEPYLKAVSMLGAETRECLVIENAPLGVEAAKRAKIECIAVSTYVSPLKLSKADLVFQDHAELIEYLGSLL